MIIPWGLVGSLALAVAAGVVVVRWRGAPLGVVADRAAGVAIPAVVVARLVVVARDAVLTGVLPPPMAVLTLGAGLSAGAGVLTAMVAVARQRRAASDGGGAAEAGADAGAGWAALVEATAVGLAVWHGAAGLRGEMGPGVPVAAIEAVMWAATAAWLLRARTRGVEVARRLAVMGAVAGVALLVGTLLRPSLPTVDADVDGVLAATAAAVGVLLVVGRARAARVVGVVGSGLLVVVVGAAGLAGSDEGVVPQRAVPVDLAGAIVAGAEVTAEGVPSLDGDDLAALVGRAEGPVVVNLWASWCPPCHAEAPAVARAASALPEDVTMVGVLVDDAVADGQAFADRYGLGFPSVRDGGIGAAVGFVGLPTTVVLRPDGTIAHREVGGLDVAGLAAAVARAR